MKTMGTKSLVSWAVAAALGIGLSADVHAEPMVFDNVSAQDAAKQISDKYGVEVVFKGDFSQPKYVTFTLNDADGQGARLQAVNALANAVGADFSKTVVVSKISADADVPVAKVDSNADVIFQATTIPAQDAIRAVAGVDNAAPQVSSDITGNVTLSATQLSASSAAQEIASQTHTRWKVFYALTPRSGGHRLTGKVIGHTNGGSPITELPYVYYNTPQQLAKEKQAEADRQKAAQDQAKAQQTADQQAAANPNPGYSPSGNGGYDYNNPYGYDPYGYGGAYYGNGSFGPGNYIFPDAPGNGYGYGFGNGSFSTGNGLTVTDGNGPIVFGNGF